MDHLRTLAYLDGELPAPQREELECVLAGDGPEAAAAARQLAAARGVWEQVGNADPAAAAAWLDSARVWPGVLDRVRATGAATGSATGSARRWLPRAAFASTLAAGLTLGIGLGFRFTVPAANDAGDLTESTSLLSAPEGSAADVYFAQDEIDGAGASLPDTGADASDAATSAPLDSAGGAR